MNEKSSDKSEAHPLGKEKRIRKANSGIKIILLQKYVLNLVLWFFSPGSPNSWEFLGKQGDQTGQS